MFQKGQSGNPKGRTKRDKTRSTLVAEAWKAVAQKKPWLIESALERGLSGARPLGFLELGAKLMKEIGKDDESKSSVTIVVNSPLNAGALRPIVEAAQQLPAAQAHPELPPAPEAETVDFKLLEGDLEKVI